MSEFKMRGTIQQDNFVAGAEELLSHADDFGVDVHTSVESAQQVITIIDQVGKGDIVIDPPLDNGALEVYTARALSIVVMGEKAQIGLDQSRSGRKRLSRLAAQQAHNRLAAEAPTTETLPAAPSFHGEGSAVKA